MLAGEVKEPDSFSIRTLDILRKLTQKDAICFAEIIPLVLKCPGDRAATFYDYFIPGSFFEKSHLMKKCGIDFPSIVRLDEARLVSSNAMISVGDVLEPKQSIVFEGAFSSFEVRNLGEKDVEMYHSAYVFTEAGKELLPVISVLQSKKAPEWYLREFAESLMKTSVEDCKNRDLEIAFF